MAKLKRAFLCDEICKKAKCKRKRSGAIHLDKRELLYINSALDLLEPKKTIKLKELLKRERRKEQD